MSRFGEGFKKVLGAAGLMAAVEGGIQIKSTPDVSVEGQQATTVKTDKKSKTVRLPTEKVVVLPIEKVMVLPTENVVVLPTERVVEMPTENVVVLPTEKVVVSKTQKHEEKQF